MKRAKSICTYPSCSTLVTSGHRCSLHPYDSMRQQLDKKKTSESRKFYSSHKWTMTSRKHREIEPLCRRCKEGGLVVQGELVHHNPERQELVFMGLDPFDHEYLETLCFRCHQHELRAKSR